MSKVIVFGSLNMDLSVSCPRVPEAGETIIGQGFLASPGGKGANQAMASARMGAITHMVGAVGKDVFGTRLVQSLVEADVLCERVRALKDVPTGTATILRAQGDNRIVVDPGANAATHADVVCSVIDDIAEPGDIFLTQLECDMDTTMDAIAYARESGLYTILNAFPAVPPPMLLSVRCCQQIRCFSSGSPAACPERNPAAYSAGPQKSHRILHPMQAQSPPEYS